MFVLKLKESLEPSNRTTLCFDTCVVDIEGIPGKNYKTTQVLEHACWIWQKVQQAEAELSQAQESYQVFF